MLENPPNPNPQLPPGHGSRQPNIVVEGQFFQGPIPPPGVLDAYNRIVPGSAEMILRWTAEETQHRRKLEEKGVDAAVENMRRDYCEVRRGQILGVVVVAVFVGGGCYVASLGQTIAGAILGGVGISAIVGSLIMGGRNKRGREQDNPEEPAEKRNRKGSRH